MTGRVLENNNTSQIGTGPLPSSRNYLDYVIEQNGSGRIQDTDVRSSLKIRTIFKPKWGSTVI
jgi:hypothetical protein